jgi:hypothetical protein
MRLIKPLLFGSLAVNLVLGTLLIRQSATAHTATPMPVQTAARAATTGLARIFNAAVEAGAPATSAYQLVLLAARTSAAAAPSYEYWKAPEQRATAAVPTTTDEQVRARLLASFGLAAREQPEFAAVFKPYSHRFPFLSSQKQLALQAILTEAASDNTAGSILVGMGSSALPCVTGTCGSMPDKIRALLAPDEFFEYQLRESALSVRLLNSGFEFTETEFRDVYRALSELRPIPGSSGSDFLAQSAVQLQRVLSQQRYAQFQRLRDPMYRLLSQVGAHYSIAKTALGTAYETITRSEQQVAVLGVGTRPPAAAEQIRIAAIYSERDQKLRSMLGSAAFSLIARYLEPNRQPRIISAAAAAYLGESQGRATVSTPVAVPLP